MRRTARTVRDFWRDQRRELARHADDLAGTPSPETVHDLRAAGRRIKATVRTFRPLLRTTLTDSLLTEIDRVNHMLGDVRDAEVLCDLVAGVAEPTDPLLIEFTAHRDRLRTEASELLAADSTRRLYRLVDELTEDPWRGRYGTKGPSAAMLSERVDHAQQRVARAWQALVAMDASWGAGSSEATAGAGTDRGTDGTDTALDTALDAQVHLLRRRAKTARFALASVGSDDDAERYEEVSDQLGLIQDAVVVHEALDGRADTASVSAVAEADRQATQARAAAPAALRAAVPEAWWPV